MKKPMHYPTSIRLTEEMRDALIRRADADGRSLTNYIGNVLRLHIEQTPEPPAKQRAQKAKRG